MNRVCIIGASVNHGKYMVGDEVVGTCREQGVHKLDAFAD